MRFLFVPVLILSALSVASALGQQRDCACEDFDKLQQELDNAVTLRDRHRAKAEELERRRAQGETRRALQEHYEAWEKDIEKGAGAGIVATTQGAQGAVPFEPAGNRIVERLSGFTSPVTKDGYTTDQLDPAKARAVEREAARTLGRDLCDHADPAALAKAAEATSFCRGMSDILKSHEDSHRATCRSMGFLAFYFREPAELARDEVKAYERQIAQIETLIGKALKGAEIEYEDETKMTVSAQMANFSYVFTTLPTRGAVPDNDGRSWRADLKGTHRTSAPSIRIAGSSCKLPTFTRTVELSVDAQGRKAQITFRKFGATPPLSIACSNGARGGGGAGGPEPSGETVEMPLRLSSSQTTDIARSKAAQMMGGVAKVSGTHEAKLRIICPKLGN